MRRNRVWVTCEHCKKQLEIIKSRVKTFRFCSYKCHGLTVLASIDPQSIPKATRERNANWKGGRRKHSNGYVWVLVNGDYILEHRHVMQQYIGRKLKHHEQIHHLNGNKLDNRIKNLEIVDIRLHTKSHWRDGHFLGSVCKLTPSKVKKIRELYLLGNHTHRSLAKKFNVTKTTIGDLLRGKTWNRWIDI